MVKQLFPPVPTPDFSPNFTGYNFNNVDDWYETYESMAQSPDDAILKVSTRTCSSCPVVCDGTWTFRTMDYSYHY